MAIRFEGEVAPALNSSPTQERPEKHQRTEEERAMEKRFEIETRQPLKNSMGRETLGRPEKDRRGQGAEKNRGDEIGD